MIFDRLRSLRPPSEALMERKKSNQRCGHLCICYCFCIRYTLQIFQNESTKNQRGPNNRRDSTILLYCSRTRRESSKWTRTEIMEKVWHLMAILDGISIHPFLKKRLVLKGGTALNLFFFDLPRLSDDHNLIEKIYTHPLLQWKAKLVLENRQK